MKIVVAFAVCVEEPALFVVGHRAEECVRPWVVEEGGAINTGNHFQVVTFVHIAIDVHLL